MALPTSYMTGNFTKIPSYFDAMLTAKAPEKFTIKFLENMGFKSSGDRLFINVLKNIGFLDELGIPTNRYFEFLDQSKSKILVANGIKEAYADLFEINVNAQTMSKQEVEGKFKTLTSGSKGERVISFMASTFINLCSYADWKNTTTVNRATEEKKVESILKESAVVNSVSDKESKASVDLCYDIHIHLPATRDPAVYDALFSSLTKHISIK